MALELNLTFADPGHVQVSLRGGEENYDPATQAFAPPLDEAARADLTWYLETYPAHYTTEIDDARAAGIAARLPEFGLALFNAVFADRAPARLYERFREADAPRLLTISGLHPSVLGQPWELLCDPDGTFLFLETPRIPIRRRLPGSGRAPFRPAVKDRVHLLFVVSRPDGSGFLDPRADPMAVMDALDQAAPGRVTVEFLRPPTLEALRQRLNDASLPPIDILHFDGHGVYDAHGQLDDAKQRAGAYGDELRDAAAPAPHGYLLFETEKHEPDLVAAATVGDLLQSKRVGLVILSACQSAMVGGDDPLASVAPRLIRAGIPAVLAMTQSVLVPTTRELSRHLYRALARGDSIGEALDEARGALHFNPKRGERRRDGGIVPLKLADWFVPALYQAGVNTPLLTRAAPAPAAPPPAADTLPPLPEAGFFGRRRELHDIERWFVDGTRRVVLTGFGGQGKSALAAEAGRWLRRAGLFARACFVSYAGFEGADPVQLAVSTLMTALGENLPDAAAAGAALARFSTLLILDNLESLSGATRAELLGAAAHWSRQGHSRVLITARPDDLSHPDFPAQGSRHCRYLPLDGLAPPDALDWFQHLLRLPPEPVAPVPPRDAVAAVFAQVGYHPLSISVLTTVLKQREVSDVAEALRAQLGRDGDRLLASLNLSLERLAPQARAALPGLGVFVDGAFDPMAPLVLELDAAGWARLRDGLRQAGLVTLEALPGIEQPFLRFHPTLAPAMRARLAPERLAALEARHRACYAQLALELYVADQQRPETARGIAARELPNLLAAAHAALTRGEDGAVDFADSVGMFLSNFGRARDREALQRAAEAASPAPGSDDWVLAQSNRGEQLYARGQFAAAASAFAEILAALGPVPTFQRATTLGRLARCDRVQGQPDRAADRLRKALRELATLPPSTDTRSLEGTLQADLGDALMDQGDLDGAQAAHEANLAIKAALRDARGVAVGEGQLGMILLRRGDLAGAARRYRNAIAEFVRLNEPASVAIGHHQLGETLLRMGDFAAAEAAYREAARLQESLGDRRGAAGTWMNLAVTIRHQRRPVAEVEPWYRKALAAFAAEDYAVGQSRTLSNLADLLCGDPTRLEEARGLAEQALTLEQTLDPGVVEIWKTYNVLATIAAAQGDAAAASRHRAAEHASFAAAPIARETLRRHRRLIDAMLAALRDPAAAAAPQPALTAMAERGRADLVAALRAMLAGGRDAAALCEPLNYEDSLIVATILRCLTDPAAHAALPAAA